MRHRRNRALRAGLVDGDARLVRRHVIGRRRNRPIDQMRGQLPRGTKVAIRGQVLTMQSSFTGLYVGLAMAIGGGARRLCQG